MELQVKNGLFRYGHRDPVLKGVGFRFGDGTGSGRILAVLGPNGAGKTTLIRLLLGHLRWTEGETLFGGRKAASLSPAELARLIGYVPQAKVPPFAVTVLEMTELGRIAFHGEFGEPDVVKKIDKITLQSRRKWTVLVQNKSSYQGESEPVLGDFFRIKRGLATGDNNFFILSIPSAHNSSMYFSVTIP